MQDLPEICKALKQFALHVLKKRVENAYTSIPSHLLMCLYFFIDISWTSNSNFKIL